VSLVTNYSPFSSKPMISWAIELVLPLFYSCWKLNTLDLKRPFPSSKVPGADVKTALKVDLPASTFPSMATRILLAFLDITICFFSSSSFFYYE
jgi:hypothetical protein